MNKHQGYVEVEITLESGKVVTLPIRYDSAALADAEQATGKTVFQMLGDPQQIGFAVLSALLFHGIPERTRLREGYRQPRDLAPLVNFRTFGDIALKVFEAIRLYMPAGLDEEGAMAEDLPGAPGEAESP